MGHFHGERDVKTSLKEREKHVVGFFGNGKVQRRAGWGQGGTTSWEGGFCWCPSIWDGILRMWDVASGGDSPGSRGRRGQEHPAGISSAWMERAPEGAKS